MQSQEKEQVSSKDESKTPQFSLATLSILKNLQKSKQSPKQQKIQKVNNDQQVSMKEKYSELIQEKLELVIPLKFKILIEMQQKLDAVLQLF